jgi:hypothetical protein
MSEISPHPGAEVRNKLPVVPEKHARKLNKIVRPFSRTIPEPGGQLAIETIVGDTQEEQSSSQEPPTLTKQKSELKTAVVYLLITFKIEVMTWIQLWQAKLLNS